MLLFGIAWRTISDMIEMQEVESYLIHESTISDHDLVECL